MNLVLARFSPVLLVLMGSLAYGQSLSGYVKDVDENDFLPGVNVFIPELQKGSVTDADGYYKLTELPQGTFKIQFSFIGYQTIIRTITINGDQKLDMGLSHQAIEVDEIIISSPYTSTQQENPVKVEQMSLSDINKTGAPTLMSSITAIPGVDQISTGMNIGKPVIRGLSYNRVLVYTQGIRLENQQWGDEHGLGLLEMGIEKVEIIKGPSSMLYGSDAMGGVLHLIEERPAAPEKIHGDYNLKLFSNTQGYSTNLGLKGASKNVRFGVRAGWQSHADYKMGNGDRVTNSRFNDTGIKANFGLNYNWMITNFNYQFVGSEIGIPEEVALQSTSRDEMNPYQALDSHLFSNQTTFFINKSKLKVNLGYSSNQRMEFEEDAPVEDGPALDMQLNTFSYDLKWYFPSNDKSAFILGLQGLSQQNSNSGEEVLIPDADINDLGGLMLGKLNLDDFTVQTGLRFDRRRIQTNQIGNIGEQGFVPAIDRGFTSLNGALGATYQSKEEWLLRVNFATGFRAPNLAELASNGPHEGTNRYEIGNPDLQNERNFEVDLGAEWQTKHFSFVLTGFYNYISDYIFLTPTEMFISGEQVYNFIQDDANLKGFESSLHVHPHPLDWLHFESGFSLVNAERVGGDDLPLIPAYKLNNVMRAEFNRWENVSNAFIQINIQTAFRQSRISEFETETPGYTLVSLGIGSQVKLGNQTADWNFTVNNLLDHDYYNHLSRLKVNGISNIGRNVSLGLKVPFGIK